MGAPKTAGTASIAFSLVVFFARHPDEELLTEDCALKLDIPPSQVRERMSRAVRDGMLSRTTGGGRGNQALYTAGPVLLRMIGAHRSAMRAEACVPAGS